MTNPALPRHTLSKSDFKTARTCATKLYYKEKRYPDTKANDPYLKLLAFGGYMVEMVAKLEFPEGEALAYGRDHAEAAAKTLQRLQAGDATLFEATLLDGPFLARADILRRRGNRFDLYEVKAGTFDQADADERAAKTGSPFKSKTRIKGGGYPILKDWSEYLEDVTYQVMVLRRLFPDAEIVPHLVLVRKEFTAPVDDLPTWFQINEYPAADGSMRLGGVTFIGDAPAMRAARLTQAIEVGTEVDELLPEVTAAALDFAASLGPELRRAAPVLGWACRDCEYRMKGEAVPDGFEECWSERPEADWHVLELYQGKDKVDRFVERGITSLLDVPTNELGKKNGELGAIGSRQLVQIDACRANTEWMDPSVKVAMQHASWPLHFIDFEAAGLAIPHHRAMRPYGQLAFQWSCHTQREPGGPLEHREWLNDAPVWPNALFARSLRDAVGEAGTILTWSHFEENVLRKVADELMAFGADDPDLAAWIDRTVGAKGTPGRILDLHRLCVQGYFHPKMGGRTSIKAVLDALWSTSPEMRTRFTELTGLRADEERGPYAALPPVVINGAAQQVVEGTGAVRAYEAMMYGVERNQEGVKEGWRELLRQYCRLDTLAMVLIWEHWTRA